MKENHLYDVAIIGCGPTGLTAASLLGQAGHKVIVIERFPEPYGLPHFSCIDGETARLLQSACDISKLFDDALAIERYFFCNGQDGFLINMDRPGGNSGFPAHIAIFQPEIEAAIYLRAQACQNVTFLRGWEVNEVTQGDGGVIVRAIVAQRRWQDQVSLSQETRQFNVKYVIGADGAGSFTRRSLGIERFSYGKHERWLNLDSEYVRDLGDRFTKNAIYCDPARTHMFTPMGRSRVRFEVRLLPHEKTADWEDIKNGLAWLKNQHDLTLEDIKPIRCVVYTFDPAIAETWRQGRVLLAGDAAHTIMPYIGQGGCSGIRDAANLAWKLDLVLAGKAEPALLETYEAERRPHVTSIMQASNMLGVVANEGDLEKVAMRNALFRSGNVPPPPPFPKLMAGVVHRQANGALHPATGAPTPQGQVNWHGQVGRMDDVIGGGFLLVSQLDPMPVLDKDTRAFLKALNCRFIVVTDEAEEAENYVQDLDGGQLRYLRENGFVAYLRRPDFLLFGGVAELSALPALINELKRKLCWNLQGSSEHAAASAV